MKLTQRTTATGVTLNDTFIHVVNTGDTSQDPTGSSYKVPLSLLSPLFTGGTGVSGSGTTNQVTYWDSSSSITSDTGFTWDGSTMKITKNSTVGGIIVDTSGDPTPASFSDKYQAGFFLSESSNNDYDPTDLNSTYNTLSIATVGLGFQTQGKIGPGIAFTFADDAATGGANASIRVVKSDTDISGETKDGTLLVLGTREADTGTGFATVKESIRIGHNQYVGINYTPDNSTNPTAMLTLGTNASDDATLAMREINGTPDQITNYGQFYVKSSDSKPYFKDSSGIEYDITTGTSGSTGGSGGMTWNLLTDAFGATTLSPNNGYVMRDVSGVGPKLLTLPSTGVNVGDKIEILATDEGGVGSLVDWNLLEGNANDVIFYTYWVPDPGLHGEYMTIEGNKSSSPLLTFINETTTAYDTRKRNAHFTLTCIADLSPGYTWQINALDGQVIN